MNKRIQELSNLADTCARSDNSAMLFENYHKRYTEKFAELILLKCCELTSGSPGSPTGAIHGYFGIEE